VLCIYFSDTTGCAWLLSRMDYCFYYYSLVVHYYELSSIVVESIRKAERFLSVVIVELELRL
jgi:hypothetical protein